MLYVSEYAKNQTFGFSKKICSLIFAYSEKNFKFFVIISRFRCLRGCNLIEL